MQQAEKLAKARSRTRAGTKARTRNPGVDPSLGSKVAPARKEGLTLEPITERQSSGQGL